MKIELRKTNASLKQGEICVRLSEAFGNQHPDSVLYCALKAEKIIKKSKFPQQKKAILVTATAFN